jgi:hypothetical protein
VIAFADESVKEDGVGTYVIGCVIAASNECPALRVSLKGRGKFHFNQASRPRREEMLRNIGEWGLGPCAYVLRGYHLLKGTTQEVARRRCLDRLLLDLRDWGVSELVLESRRRQQDTWDLGAILDALQAKRAPAGLTYGHKRSSQEPLLWPADAIASAVRATFNLPPEFEVALRKIGTEIRSVR